MQNDDLVYGWRSIAGSLGRSERHARDLVAERNLVADRRADGAVGVRRRDLVALAGELHGTPGPADQPAVGGAATAVVPAPTAPNVAPVAPAGTEPGPEHGSSGAAGNRAEAQAQVAEDGATAARAFALFREGRSPVEVVIETQLQPATIDALYDAYLKMEGPDVTSPTADDRTAKLEAVIAGLTADVGTLSDSLGDLRTAMAVADDVDQRLAGRLASAERWIGLHRDVLGALAALGGRVGTVEGRVATCEQALASWAAAAQVEAMRRARAAR